MTLDDGLAMYDRTIVLLPPHAVEHADAAQPLLLHRSGFGRIAG